MRGTTVVWGDYGLRMRDHDRRISASQLHIAEETIKKRLRGMKFRLYERVSANIGVYTSGNEVRMGKGKGTFDHWATRLSVSKVVFEIKGDLHEQVVKDAFRLAGNKLPGKKTFAPCKRFANHDRTVGVCEEGRRTQNGNHKGGCERRYR
jgi:ribosomal protein L16